MSITTVISDLGNIPSTQDPTNFDQYGDEFLGTALPTLRNELNDFATEANALAEDVNDAAAAAAAAQTAAESASNATLWVSGGPFTVGMVRYSPTNYQSYRCIVNNSGTTDPISDATNWVIVSSGGSLGLNGATPSGSVTLTASSDAVQSAVPSAWGQYFQLPDATTLTEGLQHFVLHVDGKYSMRILNGAGTLIGFAEPQTPVLCSLASNSTAAGKWALVGAEQLGFDAAATISVTVAVSSNPASQVIEVDSSRSLVLVGDGASLQGVIYNHSTGATGTVVTVRTAAISQRFRAIKTTTDQVLVVSCNATTAYEAVVLSISTNTITVNTAATATLAGNITTNGFGVFETDGVGLETVGSSWWIGYTRATTVAGIRAHTISGTTVTIGSEAATTGTGVVPVIYPITSTVALVISQTASGNIVAHPYTVSGVSLTPGTSVTITATVTSFVSRAIGSRWGLIYQNGANFTGAIVSVSGTTATATTVTINASTVVMTELGMRVISSTHAIVVYRTSAGCLYDTLYDSGGTAGSGTSLIRAYAAGTLGCVGGTPTTMWVYSPYSAVSGYFVELGVSGNDVVINSIVGVGGATAVTSAGSPMIYKQEVGLDEVLHGTNCGGKMIANADDNQFDIFWGAYVTTEPGVSDPASGAVTYYARVAANKIWSVSDMNSTSYRQLKRIVCV